MKIIIFVITMIAGLYLIDKFFLWLERRGWMYWRRKKPDVGGGIGNALLQLNAFLNPSTRYTIEAKQNKTRKSTGISDDDDT